jgi:hypothetical protein
MRGKFGSLSPAQTSSTTNAGDEEKIIRTIHELESADYAEERRLKLKDRRESV